MALTPAEVPFDNNPKDGKLDAVESQKYRDSLTAGVNPDGSTKASSSSTTSTDKTVVKLTQQSALDLLNSIKDSVGGAAPTTAQAIEFMNYFNAEAKKRIDEVTSKVTANSSGKSAAQISSAVNTAMQTQYPQFFDPAKQASDWLTTKVFATPGTATGKALDTLTAVRGIVEDFQTLHFTDNEAIAAAKDIALGHSTLAQFTIKMQGIAMQDYPQFTDRFKADPTLTVKGIQKPIIDMIASTWEVDPNTIKKTNPILMQWMHPTSADGKATQMSYYDAYLRAMNSPEREFTKAANEDARGAATSLGRAFGFGV